MLEKEPPGVRQPHPPFAAFEEPDLDLLLANTPPAPSARAGCSPCPVGSTAGTPRLTLRDDHARPDGAKAAATPSKTSSISERPRTRAPPPGQRRRRGGTE